MSLDFIKKILNETDYGLVDAGRDAGIPASLIEAVQGLEVTKAIVFTMQLSQILSAVKAKQGDFRKKIADRSVLYIGQTDAIGELLKYCDGSNIHYNGEGEYRVTYVDFVSYLKTEATLPELKDTTIMAWEKVLNNSQNIHRYKIYTKNEFQAVSHQDSCVKMLRKMEVDQKLLDRPKSVKGPHFENDPTKYMGNATRVEVISIDSPYVKEMTIPRNHRNMDLCDAQHYINEIMPVFRVGCDSMNYGYGYCYQSGLNRLQSRLLRWKILLQSISKDQLGDIVIYGASRESLDIYEDLRLCVYNPQAREDYEQRGITILTSMNMRKYCLLDPFNTIWSEFDYVEDEDFKNDKYTSTFSDLRCVGRMVRGKLNGGIDVIVPGVGMHYVPMVLHKFEYYMLPSDIKLSNYYYGSNNKGVLIQSLDFFCRINGNKPFKNSYVSPFFLVYLSNLVRNKSYLEWFFHNTPWESIRMLDLMYKRNNENYSRLVRDGLNGKADDSYINVWHSYYQFMFRILLDGCDPGTRKTLFDDSTCELTIDQSVSHFKTGKYSVYCLYYLYSANRINKRRQNYDKRQEVPLIPEVNETEKDGCVDTRIYMNHSSNNVSSYSLLNKYPLKSRKDDIFLDLNVNTAGLYDKLDHMKVTFRNKGQYSDEVVIRRKDRSRRLYNGSVITSKPLLRVIRQKDRSDFNSIDFSHSRSQTFYGSRAKSLDSPVIVYDYDNSSNVKSKNFYGLSHNYVSRSGVS